MQNKLLYSELTKGSSFILAFFFLALFSFQDAVFVVFLRFFALFSSAVLVRRLIYYTTLSDVCQAFFQKFFGLSFAKVFTFNPSSSLSPDRLDWISLASHFFAKLYPLRLFSFPKLRRFSDLRASLSRPTALLLYHGFGRLSTPFDVKEQAVLSTIFVYSFHNYLLKAKIRPFQKPNHHNMCRIRRIKQIFHHFSMDKSPLSII